MTWKTLALFSLLSPAAVHAFTLTAPLAQSGPRVSAPAAFSRCSSVQFSAASLEVGEGRRFGLVPTWSAISETVASALSLVRSEAQQRSRNLVLAIHTTGPMIRATRLLDALSATEARLRAALSITRAPGESVVVDVGDNRIDAAVKLQMHYLQMLTGPRHSTLAKQYRDVNEDRYGSDLSCVWL